MMSINSVKNIQYMDTRSSLFDFTI